MCLCLSVPAHTLPSLAVNWLDHGRTLREQGIDDNETLLLRRKFFYSDQNVDSRDPVQLNLLYVQVQHCCSVTTHQVFGQEQPWGHFRCLSGSSVLAQIPPDVEGSWADPSVFSSRLGTR